MPLGRRRRPKFDPSAYDSIISGVKTIYKDKVRPLEEQYMVKDFHYPLLTDDDFDAKPMVLLIGSYSVGKTSFVEYLLDRDYPGMHIGPEPTTDRFQAIMHGAEERELPGHTLVSAASGPFRELSQFGNAFLQRFMGCEVPSDFAKGCTLIDTPGILAGRKQTDDRHYSYEEIIKWFAPRVDMILLMFDANKIDIADEMKRVIQHLEGYDDKIRVVLNKADCLDPADLLKVNSALTWALARILKAPEVRRIYVGSFWKEPLQPSYLGELFERESTALLADMSSLPRNNTTAKLNDLVYRTRMVRVQALVLHTLRAEMPKMTGKDKKQRELIAGLEEIFLKVSKTYNIPTGDFPDVAKFRHTLATSEACRDFTKFKKLDEKLMQQLDAIIRDQVGALMSEFEAIPSPDFAAVPSVVTAGTAAVQPASPPVRDTPPPSRPADPWAASAPPAAPPYAGRASGSTDPWGPPPSNSSAAPHATADVIDGLFAPPGQHTKTPPAPLPSSPPAPPPAAPTPALPPAAPVSAATSSALSVAWAVTSAEKSKYDSIFSQMQPEGGRVSGGQVAPVLKRSGLETSTLKLIWNLVDVNNLGTLDADWFAVAMNLTMRVKRGGTLPDTLPADLVPPKDR